MKNEPPPLKKEAPLQEMILRKKNTNIKNCHYRVHSQPGNQGIVREFENGPFFAEKSGNYQGILVECQGNQGQISLKNIFQ